MTTPTTTPADLVHLASVHASGSYDLDHWTGEAVTRVPSSHEWITSQQVEALLVDDDSDGWAPTTTQILALRSEAAEAGDTDQVGSCDRALGGDAGAIRDCARVIVEAIAAGETECDEQPVDDDGY